jgi:hypothetical protein
MKLAAVLRELMAAGLSGDALVQAVERLEANAASTRTARNARYYEAHKDEIKTKRKTSEPTDATETSEPEPPRARVVNTTSSLRSEGEEGSSLRSEPTSSLRSDASVRSERTDVPGTRKREITEYPPDFELLWEEFPKNPNGSKKDAFKSWRSLPAEDKQACFDGAVKYRAHIDSETKVRLSRNRDPPPICHLAVFVNGRRWEGWNELNVGRSDQNGFHGTAFGRIRA